MNLINLNLYQIALGTSTFESASGGCIFNVDDIISPIRNLGSGRSYFYTRADRGRKHNIIQNGYRVLNSLAAIKNQSTQLVSLTVTKRSARNISNEIMLFDARKVFENAIPIIDIATGLSIGTVFKYEEERENYFVEYQVTNSLASIYAQTQAGALPGGNNYEDTQTITGTSMTLTFTPLFIYGVFLNGQRLTLTTDYTIAGNIITFVNSLSTDSVTVSYTY